jgi:hypothetical protein
MVYRLLHPSNQDLLQRGLSGYAIEAVDGITAGQIIREAESAMRPPYNSSGRTAIITKAILGRIYGTPDTEVSICYSDEKGQKVEKKLIRTKRNGVAVGPNGILYLAVDFEAKRFDTESDTYD